MYVFATANMTVYSK